MIDTLITNLNKLEKPDFFDKYKLTNKEYIVLTMHRPSNVDKEEELEKCLMEILNCTDKKIIFPVHPRTKKIINKLKFYDNDNIIMVNPLSYLQFNYLVKNSYLVITDSGGITEETTLYGVPCMTFRDSTERPETVELGTNVLIGKNPKNFSKYFDILKKNKWKEGKIPDLWDGKTSDRILEKIIHLFSLKK
jgi:UDP-N-acetylglucosamine 2-epimerase (non-hydrolysing)